MQNIHSCCLLPHIVRTTSTTTTRSPLNLALGISKILTLRLALRLFGKLSNDGTTVYGSGYLRPNELLHVHHVGEGRGARGRGECVLLRPFQYGLHTEQNE